MAHHPGVYARLPTEKPNPRTRHIDLKSALEIVRVFNREDEGVARAVGREAASLARAAQVAAACLSRGGRLIFVGAGTSGRLGVLEAAECPPTFNTEPGQIQAVMAGGKSSVFRSKEGAEDDPRAGAAAVRGFSAGDVVVGIAASGITPFVQGALEAARRRGCRTVLVTSNGRPAGNPAEITIAPRVGPEVIAGSTRMKSGTAAKLVLNTLTSAAMIRLGKVHDHWMVDLKPTSRKLRLRGVRIICDLGRVSPARAQGLFKKSGWSVKLAVLMARSGLSLSDARLALEKAGSLRRALESL
ncbi:MAG: N-acetylmuramic acid 6-phosphate etherase [Elusimicrobia bacterium]|nr:N-acetylmuramic acid 6-phosphate etherase [Elusimicrobiota bacterium]